MNKHMQYNNFYSNISINRQNNFQKMINNSRFNNSIFQGNKGRVLLQLSKTYKGDDRFKLNQKFKEDLDIQKLPQKFKQIAQKQIIDQALGKTKKITKKLQPSLMIQRFQPGTQQGNKMVKKAEGRQHYIQSIKKGMLKQKKKISIKKGIDMVKKADMILNKKYQKKDIRKPEFKIQIKGNRQQAFQKSDFKLFE